MEIHIYNTLTKRREPLVPLQPGRLGIYVCGVTVYDYCHIGHARVMVVFDVVVRYLRARGYAVHYVRNFTDIDDKIIRRAAELAIPITELTTRFIDAFTADMTALGVAPADVEPRATDHIPQMQAIISRLLERGLAYPGAGDIYYAVDRFAGYGKLSGKALADLEAGARVAVDERKANPLDFVLWKGAKPGEPQWDSPWGAGRPGWHIECSAMSSQYLGNRFDIHGGGMDLIFPHHENEIAQSEGATGHPWVRYWMHNGFVNVVAESGTREKMSKSLGNFHTIRDLLARFAGESLRLFILNSHYRSPLDFSWQLLAAAAAGMDRLYGALQHADQLGVDSPPPPPEASSEFLTEIDQFHTAMSDDFNTPRALAVLFEIARRINRTDAATVAVARAGAATLRTLGGILGLCVQEPVTWFRSQPTEHGPGAEEIEDMIQQRLAARNRRDFAAADAIRAELSAQGVTLEDSRDGTTWRRGG